MVRRVDFMELGRTDPLQTLRLIYFPGKRLTTILVRGIRNTSEDIGEVSRTIAAMGGRVLVMRPSNPAGEVIDILYTVECPPDREDEIASGIERLGRAEEVLIVEMPKEDLAVNILFPYMAMGERGVIVTKSVLIGLLEEIRERIGQTATQALLYMIGLGIGREICRRMHPILLGRDVAESLKHLVYIMRSIGVCRPRSVELKEELVELEILDNLEADVLGKGHSSPQCHNTRGVLAGFLAELTGESWQVEEVECEAAEGQYCRFIAKPREMVDRSNNTVNFG